MANAAMMGLLKKRVLILEDDATELRVVKHGFERFDHGHRYEITTASTRPEVFTVLRSGPPDLHPLRPELQGFAMILGR